MNPRLSSPASNRELWSSFQRTHGMEFTITDNNYSHKCPCYIFQRKADFFLKTSLVRTYPNLAPRPKLADGERGKLI